MLRKVILACSVVANLPFLVACTAATVSQNPVAEVMERPNRFTAYPQPGTTYLSFSQAHGFQVNYIGNGRAWLWYPGNSGVVPEEWKTDTIGGTPAICWRHPSGSYNPVTKQTGGGYACQSLVLSQKTIVASLQGDPFNLRSGAVPYRLNRCTAPEAFVFDRSRFGCN